MAKYNLTTTEIKNLAIICYREQGGIDSGVRACASQMCNYYENWQKKKYTSVYDCIIKSGWYRDEAFNLKWIKEHPSVPDKVVSSVKDVIVNGNKSLPDYVDEYDCLSDIVVLINDGVSYTDRDYINNRKNYVKDKTIIQNRYAESSFDRYTFYCFPDGVSGQCDAFGYIKKGNTMNEASNGIPSANTTSVASIREKAISWMEKLANDPSHGYDQAYRWGEKGDYDCSSSVINAWEQAGVKVKSAGATYTGNMYAVFIKLGFVDVTSKVNLATGAGMLRSDILLNHQKHVAMYCGNGKEVEASVNEKGTATGGKPGDQTGREILIRSYRNFPWNVVLRYTGGAVVSIPTGIQNVKTFEPEYVELGDTGASVFMLQSMLRSMFYLGKNNLELEIDGEAGANTIYALKNYQETVGLNADGECGPKTWKKLKESMKT